MCTDCSGHFPWSLNEIQCHIINDLVNLPSFHFNGTSQKVQQHHVDQCTFLIHNFISFSSNFPDTLIASLGPHFNLIFFCFGPSDFLYRHKSHLIQPISYSSISNINSRLDQFALHSFCYTFSWYIDLTFPGALTSFVACWYFSFLSHTISFIFEFDLRHS